MESASAPAEAKDFVGIAIAYAKDAASERNRDRFGKWVRLAARRFLADLERAKRPGTAFTFDRWHAEDPCRFIELLPHVEGKWDSRTIVLHPAHVFLIVNLFGFRKPDGTRRFTTLLYAVARKNAKSTILAGILLYCQLCEGEVGPQVVSAATTGAQARIVFNIAKRMVEQTPDLQAAFSAEAFANAIASYDNGGTFKPINAKASTQDGLNPSAVGVDEVHAHQTHDLLNVLRSAAGARANPLFAFTTTEGYENPGPWAELRTFCRQVLQGVIDADHFLGIIYALDEKDDDFDERAWQKANPLSDVNPLLLAEIRKESVEAKGMPGRLAEFRIKRLNRPSSTATGFIDLPKWNRCDGPVDVEKLRGLPCYAGLDLASTQDTVALVVIWIDEDAGLVYVWCRFWVPSEAIKRREARGVTPYAGWAEQGLLTVVDGEVIDYSAIEAEVVRVHREFGVTEFAYDPWNATQLVGRLMEDHSVPMVEFVQGFRSYHPALQELQRLYVAGLLVHGGNPVLRWNASNLVAVTDENNNLKPSKKRSADKIDGMCALAMAIGISQRPVESTDIEQGFVVL